MRTLISCLALLGTLLLPAASHAAKTPQFPLVEHTLLKKAPVSGDFYLGTPNARIVFIEYASLTCPHCAHFHKDIFPALKKRYIDTGKMVYILRQFPLNEPALKAAMLVDCVGEKEGAERYYTFVRVLFDGQSKWAFSHDFLSSLETFAKVGGVPKETFTQCTSDTKREIKLLTAKKDGTEQLKIAYTPYLFINGHQYDDEVTLEKVTAYIDSLAKGGK